MRQTGKGVTTTNAADHEYVIRKVTEADLTLIRILYCDADNVIRGKATTPARLRDRLQSGIGLAIAMQAFTMLDHLASVEGVGAAGEVRLLPDPQTFVVAPYVDKTGITIADMITSEAKPSGADPRGFLRRMVELANQHGWQLVAAFEPEWSLARLDADGRLVPADQTVWGSTDGMNRASPVVNDIISALEAQGISVEDYLPELGWGQQEISIGGAPALRAADNQILYRETVRGVAFKHGLAASFAPKPWPDQAGNGCHIHFSAWSLDSKRNVFDEQGATDRLSAFARRFMAGVLDHLYGLVALTSASVNSYRRLKPQSWSSAYRAWGLNNRETSLRVVVPHRIDDGGSMNVEFRPADSSGNPYLALGGLIAAGLDGVERQLDLGAPIQVDPHSLGAEERAQASVGRLPINLEEALDALKSDRVLCDALGDEMLRTYLAVKESDVREFAEGDAEFEFRRHALAF